MHAPLQDVHRGARTCDRTPSWPQDHVAVAAAVDTRPLKPARMKGLGSMTLVGLISFLASSSCQPK